MPVATRNDLISRGGTEWELGAVYKLEHERVIELIKDEALRAVSKTGTAKDVVFQEATGRDEILTMKSNVKRKFHPDNRLEFVDKSKFQAAQHGDFQNLSPTKSTVVTTGIIAVVAVLVELAVVIAISLSEGELSILQIIMAVVLGAGGWLAGMGLGQVMFNTYVDDQKKKGKTWVDLSEKINMSSVAMTFCLGLLLVIACSAFRYIMADKEIIAGGITLMLGLFIMISEAIAYKNKILREKYLNLMFQAQVYYAVDEHNKFNPAVISADSHDLANDQCALAYLQAVKRS